MNLPDIVTLIRGSCPRRKRERGEWWVELVDLDLTVVLLLTHSA
jgi:hypothetical protein